MKKIAILLLTMSVLSSCSLFQKPSMTQEQIDAMTSENAKLKEEIAAQEQEIEILKIQAAECAQLVEEQASEEVITGSFHVIAGSFKNPKFAEEYAVTIKNNGGLGSIIDGPSGFQFVVYSSHSGIRAAINQMIELRKDISKDAWVYSN